jgi:hypothetical protein
MQKEFADHYGFSPENTIVYENDLTGAIIQALTMSDDEYLRMKADLKHVSRKVKNESLYNLKSRLDNQQC